MLSNNSHFKYAYKAIELDESGQVLDQVLLAIKTVFPLQEEIDQGLFIGLTELQRLVGTTGRNALPRGWMITVLNSAKSFFTSSYTVHSKAKKQWEHSHPGAGWNAPLAMSNTVIRPLDVELPYLDLYVSYKKLTHAVAVQKFMALLTKTFHLDINRIDN